MAKTMLGELSEGMAVQTLACARQLRLTPFKNKAGSFLRLMLSDRSGSMTAKLWEDGEAVAASIADGSVVKVTGRMESYQGSTEITLTGIAPWDGPVDPADFLPAYPGDVRALIAKFDALVNSIEDPEISLLLRSLFDDPEIRRKYCEAPAARGVHGAYLHGLLEHVVRQAELAETAARSYPQVDRDLLIAGVLLHDIGKIEEFDWEHLAIEYSTIGNLHGHIIIGDRLVYEWARGLQLSDELTLRLRHLILSHHGTGEFGAPVLPKMLEAVILHCVDNLEAKATHCIEMLRNGNTDNTWTEYDRLEGRVWYRGAPRVPAE
jgi:3'-5' exoribonuclease